MWIKSQQVYFLKLHLEIVRREILVTTDILEKQQYFMLISD